MTREVVTIVQLTPINVPLWILYAVDTPDADGNSFLTEPVICLALQERSEIDTAYVVRTTAAREVVPVVLADGSLKAVDGSLDESYMRIIGKLPVSEEERTSLNIEAAEHLESRKARRETLKDKASAKA
jgi:hypothetical protein